MEPITYSLTNGARRSDQFYADIDALTDEVIAAAEPQFGALVADYVDYLRANAIETPRTDAEYYFELLTLGVLWRSYAHSALDLAPLPQRTLNWLARQRERGGRMKQVADRARGVLSTLFLARNGHHDSPAPTLDHLDKLIAWLAAVGDFKEEVRRLRLWQGYFAALPKPEALRQENKPGSPLKGLAETGQPAPSEGLQAFDRHSRMVSTSGGTHTTPAPTRGLAAVIAFADWFETHSLDTLGAYTAHVETFLAEKHPAYRWRENRIFTGRQRVEYHLNMVGTTIMNRAFRAAFQAADRQIVFVPPCMRARQDGSCAATPTPYGERCAGCEPACRVHQVTKLGEKHGFLVFMLPDDLEGLSPDAARGSSASSESGAKPALGIVGVSCALTNAAGGWKTRRLGIPAQGLLLDYVGCYWHWHKDGIPTAINLGQLLKIIGAEEAQKTDSVQT
ncbi:MAG: DUF116 domain-containing protein [Anaerolineae bacterium]|nr:DUF116 domain-containing protein [Anaerolineae bacterium]